MQKVDVAIFDDGDSRPEDDWDMNLLRDVLKHFDYHDKS